MVCVGTQECQHDGRHSEKEFWYQPRTPVAQGSARPKLVLESTPRQRAKLFTSDEWTISFCGLRVFDLLRFASVDVDSLRSTTRVASLVTSVSYHGPRSQTRQN